MMNKHDELIERMTAKLDAIPDDLRGRPNDVFREYEEARDLLEAYGNALEKIADKKQLRGMSLRCYAQDTIEQEKGCE